MKRWVELSQDFEALEPQLVGVRLDMQWGSGGDTSYLAGSIDATTREKFLILAEIAGDKLATLGREELPDSIANAADSRARWYAALREWSSAHEPSDFGRYNGGGWIAMGRIRRPAQASANLCLQLERLAMHRADDVERALSTAGLAGAAAHWRKAQAFADSQAPDLANAAKEAVSALEAVAKHVTQLPSGTLGECLKHLRSTGSLNAALSTSLEKLWGFVNESPGVRHGSPTPVRIQPAEFRFVRSVSEAGMWLLLDRTPATERGVAADEAAQVLT